MNVRTRRDPLAGTRPSFMPAPEDPVDPARRERELRAIFDQPRPTGTRPPLMRRRLPVVGMTAAAMAVAVVVVATTASETPEVGQSPRQLLLAAADATATADAPASGRYWHVRTQRKGISAMWPGQDHDAYLVTVESGSESWTSRTGADKNVSVHQIDLTTRPLTERDRAEWDKAGNPVGIPDASPAPDAPPAPPMPTSVPPYATWQTGEQVFTIGGVSTPLSEVLTLPADPVRLKAFLLDRFRASGDSTDENEWLMWEADALLNGVVPTTPGTRAAAYRMLADLPGFRTLDGAELPDGTVGVARTVRGGWNYTVENGLVEWQVIIDPDTGSMREWRLVLVEPGTEDRRLPVGTVVHTETVEQVGWVDTDPVIPPGAEHFGGEPGK